MLFRSDTAIQRRRIDRVLLGDHGVREYVVRQLVTEPSVPEDDEVILVAAGGGELPGAVVVEVIEIAV